jgi:hypothetical protein
VINVAIAENDAGSYVGLDHFANGERCFFRFDFADAGHNGSQSGVLVIDIGPEGTQYGCGEVVHCDFAALIDRQAARMLDKGVAILKDLKSGQM